MIPERTVKVTAYYGKDEGMHFKQHSINHYTPVLPVLLLRGGRDISQGNFIKRGTLGQKVGDIEKQYYQCPTFFAKSGGH